MIMQLCGNLDNADAFTYATEIIGNISFRLTAKSAFTLPYPVIVDNSIIFEILMHDEKVRANMDLIESCNKLIVNLGVPNETNCLYKSGYLKPADLAMLQTRGAVGSICCHYFNNNGEICDQQLDKRTVSISYESIKKAELVMCCICGHFKAKALQAALKASLIDVLAVDYITAELVLKLDEEDD